MAESLQTDLKSIQPSSPEEPNHNNNSKKWLLILGGLLLLLSIGFGLLYWYVNPAKQLTTIMNITPTVVQTNTTVSNNSFLEILKQNCDNANKIAKSYFPLIFTSSFQEKYNFTDTLTCAYSPMVPAAENKDRGFLLFEDRLVDEGNNRPLHSVIIGTKNSDNAGMEDSDFSTFDTIEQTLEVKGYKISVEVLSPGPYGLSSQGIWLRIKGYRKLGDYLIIAQEFPIIEVEGDVGDMLAKYKDVMPTGIENFEGFPEYTANGKADEFKAEFISTYILPYPNNDSRFKTYIDRTVSDLDSISLSE